MAKKILCALMPEQFQDLEFNEPITRLKEAGHTIDIGGFKPGVAIGAFGHQCTPNIQLAALTPQELQVYDMLFIPGGPGSVQYLWNNKILRDLINYFHEHKKTVAAICYAVIPLVQAGILKNKQATVFPTDEAKEIFKKNNVTFLDQGVVVLEQEKIITGQGPTFARPFGKALVEFLAKQG